MKKIRVAIVTHFPSDVNKPRGGVEAVSAVLSRYLAAFDDLEIHVVTMRREIQKRVVRNLDDFTAHVLPAPKGSAFTNAIGKGRRLICEYLEALTPDLIHAHDTYGIMVRNLNMPRVFTVHGFIYADTLVSETRAAWIRSKLWKFIEISSWRRQNKIISISPYVRERLCFFKVPPERIVDIDNPIDESFFYVKNCPEKKRLLSCAVISPRKNTLALVHALSRLRDEGLMCNLRLAGHVVDNEYYNLVRAKVQRLGLESHVHFLGALTADEIRNELSKTNLFLLVSLEENAPLVIEEAMASGVPVITSNRCGMPYMVDHGETGFLVDPMDVSDIILRIKEVLSNDFLRKKMGEKAKKIANERFAPHKVAQKTRKIYLEMLNRRKNDKCNGQVKMDTKF